MMYAIETLEIELNKWKAIDRQYTQYMYTDPNENYAIVIANAQRHINELSRAIVKLKD